MPADDESYFAKWQRIQKERLDRIAQEQADREAFAVIAAATVLEPEPPPRTSAQRIDALLVEVLRLRQALTVLYHEAGSELEFDNWVEAVRVQA